MRFVLGGCVFCVFLSVVHFSIVAHGVFPIEANPVAGLTKVAVTLIPLLSGRFSVETSTTVPPSTKPRAGKTLFADQYAIFRLVF